MIIIKNELESYAKRSLVLISGICLGGMKKAITPNLNVEKTNAHQYSL
jgi:hypothetical protein